MSPTSPYSPDLTKVSAGIIQLPKGDYEFAVSDGKPFKRERKEKDNSTTELFGVQYNLVVTRSDEPEYMGKTIPFQVYLHSDKAFGIVKRFVMACLGFPVNEENEFNEKYKDADWSANPDEPLGGIWKDVVGTKVAATADLVPQKGERAREGQLNQQFNWRPI